MLPTPGTTEEKSGAWFYLTLYISLESLEHFGTNPGQELLISCPKMLIGAPDFNFHDSEASGQKSAQKDKSHEASLWG